MYRTHSRSTIQDSTIQCSAVQYHGTHLALGKRNRGPGVSRRGKGGRGTSNEGSDNGRKLHGENIYNIYIYCGLFSSVCPWNRRASGSFLVFVRVRGQGSSFVSLCTVGYFVLKQFNCAENQESAFLFIYQKYPKIKSNKSTALTVFTVGFSKRSSHHFYVPGAWY